MKFATTSQPQLELARAVSTFIVDNRNAEMTRILSLASEWVDLLDHERPIGDAKERALEAAMAFLDAGRKEFRDRQCMERFVDRYTALRETSESVSDRFLATCEDFMPVIAGGLRSRGTSVETLVSRLETAMFVVVANEKELGDPRCLRSLARAMSTAGGGRPGNGRRFKRIATMVAAGVAIGLLVWTIVPGDGPNPIAKDPGNEIPHPKGPAQDSIPSADTQIAYAGPAITIESNERFMDVSNRLRHLSKILVSTNAQPFRHECLIFVDAAGTSRPFERREPDEEKARIRDFPWVVNAEGRFQYVLAIWTDEKWDGLFKADQWISKAALDELQKLDPKDPSPDRAVALFREAIAATRPPGPIRFAFERRELDFMAPPIAP